MGKSVDAFVPVTISSTSASSSPSPSIPSLLSFGSVGHAPQSNAPPPLVTGFVSSSASATPSMSAHSTINTISGSTSTSTTTTTTWSGHHDTSPIGEGDGAAAAVAMASSSEVDSHSNSRRVTPTPGAEAPALDANITAAPVRSKSGAESPVGRPQTEPPPPPSPPLPLSELGRRALSTSLVPRLGLCILQERLKAGCASTSVATRQHPSPSPNQNHSNLSWTANSTSVPQHKEPQLQPQTADEPVILGGSIIESSSAPTAAIIATATAEFSPLADFPILLRDAQRQLETLAASGEPVHIDILSHAAAASTQPNPAPAASASHRSADSSSSVTLGRASVPATTTAATTTTTAAGAAGSTTVDRRRRQSGGGFTSEAAARQPQPTVPSSDPPPPRLRLIERWTLLLMPPSKRSAAEAEDGLMPVLLQQHSKQPRTSASPQPSLSSNNDKDEGLIMHQTSTAVPQEAATVLNLIGQYLNGSEHAGNQLEYRLSGAEHESFDGSERVQRHTFPPLSSPAGTLFMSVMSFPGSEAIQVDVPPVTSREASKRLRMSPSERELANAQKPRQPSPARNSLAATLLFNKKTGLPVMSSPDPRESAELKHGFPFDRNSMPVHAPTASVAEMHDSLNAVADNGTPMLPISPSASKISLNLHSASPSALAARRASSGSLTGLVMHSPARLPVTNIAPASTLQTNTPAQLAGLDAGTTPVVTMAPSKPISIRPSPGVGGRFSSPETQARDSWGDSGAIDLQRFQPPPNRRPSFVGNASPPRPSPPPRRLSIGMSPTHTPATKTLVGSFEESILQGRMSTADAYSIPGFTAELAVSGEGKQLPHVSIPFSPVFYSLPGEDAPTPYVANIELAHRDDPGRHPALLKVPVRGMVQLAIFNPQQTGVRVFLVRYDHSEMPPRTKTFVRQRTIDETFSNGAIRYLAHLRFVCLKKSVYLHGGIRVVFAHRTLDSAEGLSVITDGPSNPRYIPLTRAERVELQSMSSSGPSSTSPSHELGEDGMLHRGRSGSVDDDDALKCAPTTQVAFSL